MKAGYGADDYFVWFGPTAFGSVAQVAIDLQVLSHRGDVLPTAGRSERPARLAHV